MMNYNEFKRGLLNALDERYGFDYKIEERKVTKANIGEMNAISISTGNTAAQIYPELMYEEYSRGRSIDSMVDSLEEGIRSMPQVSDVDKSREGILSNVYYKMVGIPGNETYLADKPYTKAEGFDDIALVPTIGTEAGGRYGTIKITTVNMERAGITAEELHIAASANTDKMIRFRNLGEHLAEMMAGMMPPEMFDSPLYVAIDSNEMRGAAPLGAPSVVKQFHEQLGDHFVIPSSVHEVLVISKEIEPDVSRLQGLVGEVNREILKPEEKLADSVYECKDGKYITHSFGAGAEIGAEESAKNTNHL